MHLSREVGTVVQDGIASSEFEDAASSISDTSAHGASSRLSEFGDSTTAHYETFVRRYYIIHSHYDQNRFF